MTRLVWILTVFLAVTLVTSSGLCPALEIKAAAATKKSSRKGQPALSPHTPADETATIPSANKSKNASPAPSPAPAKEDETIPPAFNLPTASRARMKACGESWQAMKMSGEARDQTWRAYATKCLASKDGPKGDGEKTTRP